MVYITGRARLILRNARDRHGPSLAALLGQSPLLTLAFDGFDCAPIQRPMGAFETLRQFFSPKQSFVAPVDDPFIQLDRAEAAREMKLEERGTEQGTHDLPPADTRTFDHVEAEIIAQIRDHHSRAQIDAANQLRTYDGRLVQLGLLAELASIKSEAITAVSDFNAEVVNGRNRLATSRDAIAESYAELREFKKTNRLTRPAHAVPPKIATWGTILVSWLFETVANTFLLRLNDAMGFVGGFLAAGVVAALNVGVSAFVGRLVLPLTSHPQPLRRYGAFVGAAGWIALLGFWNLAAAHYRDAKSAGITNPEGEALSLMGSHPFALESLYSVGLLIVGIMCAVLAARAAYLMDDPYPGYGSISRRHGARCADYADDIEEATEELRSIRDDAIVRAEEVRSELGTQLRERDRVLAGRQAFCRRYEENSVQMEQTANALLELYRSANRRARAAPAPPHFSEPWKMERAPLPDSHTPAAQQGELKGAENALEQAVLDIAKRFDSALESFESLEALKARLSDGTA